MIGLHSFRFASFRLISICAALVLTASAAYAQGSHSLQGKVGLPNGVQPANPVKVTLLLNGARVFETFTDLSGRFSFSGLRRGRYQIVAEGDGRTFETTTAYAEISAFGSAPQIFTQNVQLRLKAGATVPRANTVSADEFEPDLPAQAKKEYEKGMKRADDNQPEKAIKHFKVAIDTYPAFYSAHTAMADQLAKLQQFGEAVEVYQKAITLKPKRFEGHVGLGVVYVKQKRYDEAVAPLRQAIELDKRSSTPYLFLGFAEMMTGEYAPAEQNLLRAYEIDKPTIAHIYLANLYELRGEPEKAVEHLKSFLKENPDNPNSGRIREAIDKLKKQMSEK